MIERTITKSIRFSLAEYEQVISELEKTNLSFSSFTRNLLLKKKINSKTDDKITQYKVEDAKWYIQRQPRNPQFMQIHHLSKRKPYNKTK